MAEGRTEPVTTEEEDSDDDTHAITDAFRYMPLDDAEDHNHSNDENLAENGLSIENGMQSSMVSSRSGCNSNDSSDIEVIHELSSSIEVLDEEDSTPDNASYPEEKQNEEYNQNVERSRVDNELDLTQSKLEVVGDTSSSGMSSETGTIKSNSTSGSRDEPMDLPGTSHPHGPHREKLEAEAREIFAAIDALDRDRSENSSSPTSSSLSGSSFNSPSHNRSIPLEPDILMLENIMSDRPDSLVLPRPLQYYEKRRLMKKDSSASSLSEFSSRSSSMDALIEAAMSTPLQNQGVVTTEGEMVAFVASGLDQLIRMSSPLSRDSGNLTPKSVTSMSSSASGWSTSSASGWSYAGLSRSPSVLTQSPDEIPPIDPRALMELEMHARHVAGSVDEMMKTLGKNLFKMSSITYDCIDAYRDGIDNTCDSVDGGIKSMYALMAKCEELSKRMAPIYKLQKEIQEIKRLLSLFETQTNKPDKAT